MKPTQGTLKREAVEAAVVANEAATNAREAAVKSNALESVLERVKAAASRVVKFAFPRNKLVNDAAMVRNYFVLNAPAGTPLSRITEVDTYMAIRPDLRVGDILEIREATLAWWVQALVVTLHPRGVSVRILQQHEFSDLGESEFEEKSEYEIIYTGLEGGYEVRRRSDNVKMNSAMFSSREQASEFLRVDLLPRSSRKFG